jgi:hypothetical protein
MYMYMYMYVYIHNILCKVRAGQLRNQKYKLHLKTIVKLSKKEMIDILF